MFEKRFVGLFLMALLAWAPASTRAETSDRDILAKADEMRGALTGAEWTLDVTEANGNAAQLQVIARNLDFVADYQSPVENLGDTLVQRDLDMWFIKPGVSKPIPISPRQKLLGAASYGDIASMRLAVDYRVVRRTDETCNGKPCYRFLLEASTDKATYDRLTVVIDKETGAAVSADVASALGGVIKSVVMTYQVLPNGNRFVAQQTISQSSGSTVLKYSGVSIKETSESSFVLTNIMARR